MVWVHLVQDTRAISLDDAEQSLRKMMLTKKKAEPHFNTHCAVFRNL